MQICRRDTKIALCGIACVFPARHRVRVAVSTAYWPIVRSSPATARVTVVAGHSALHLPVRPEVLTKASSTADAFVLHAKQAAWGGETPVFSRTWDLRVPRDNL